jgi:SAM-dependent methyltransferase
MGINASAIRIFLRESEREGFGRNLLTLGRQDIFVTAAEMDGIFADFGRSVYVPTGTPHISSKAGFAAGGFIPDEYLFSALGFKEFRSLDVSEYENADYRFDLNQPETPEHLRGSWDVIFDGGTIEHVFHLPNALANIFRMLKVGGRIIHIAPSSNHIDHGFYMFSPTLFWDYYCANFYEVNVCEVFCYRSDDVYGGKWAISDYVPGALTRVSHGGLDDGIYGIIMIATKTVETTCDAIPQQGLYSNIKWHGREPDEDMLGHERYFESKGLGLKIKHYL